MRNIKSAEPKFFEEENPEWTAKDIGDARPAAEVLARLIGDTATRELFRRGRGRPPKQDRKVNQTLRLDADVLEAYRRRGRGWQTLINQVLRENMPGEGSDGWEWSFQISPRQLMDRQRIPPDGSGSVWAGEPDDADAHAPVHHAHSMALFTTYYNFVRIHKTLRVSPAMAAGVSHRLWEVSDIVALLEAAEPKPGKRSPY
jgi:uncharacterized protein (DUF4415 family)